MKTDKTYLSIDELISLPTLSNINISDTGSNVAFIKTVADWNKNRFINQIWTYDKLKSTCKQLNSKGTALSSPQWSPDSKYIAYLAVSGEETYNNKQIFIKTMDDQREFQITFEEEGVIAFKWSPCGSGFYYTSLSEESMDILRRRDKYGDFEHKDFEHRNNRLSYIEFRRTVTEIESSICSKLTDSKDFHIRTFDLSNDSRKIFITASPTPEAKYFYDSDMYILDIESRKLSMLPSAYLIKGQACFSPDGSKVCYTASLREKEHYVNHIIENTIEIYDIESASTIRVLKDFDSTVTPIRWTDRGILITWQNKTDYLIGLISEDGNIDVLNEKRDCFITDVSITPDGNHLSYSKSKPNETFEVYLDNKRITDENSVFIDKLKSTKKVVSWESSDSLLIEGVLTLPTDFDSTKKYPLLVLLHGGPAYASFPIHSSCFNEKYPVEQFIEKGFIVLEPNYRGSSGYGNDFLKANYKNLGIGDYADIISGVDMLVDKGFVDIDKLGVMGSSQGGYISAFCSTYSDRFKAISVGGGITNWTSNYVNTDLPQFIKRYLGDTPWDNPEIYAKVSPITYIKSACTPTLIQHGESDARVPITNSYELYRGLKDMGVDTELVVFKGMAYNPVSPSINKAIMKQNLIWFSHYILGETIEDFRSF